MFDNNKVLAIIPARGGSKGIPGKNIKCLCGHPLIAYTINAALKSRYVDDVLVSTDSEEIARISNQYGAETPFLRPSHLAQDTSKSVDALVHARDYMRSNNRVYDSVVLLQPTSPLRRASDIDGAIESYYSHGRIGVASVQEAAESPVLTRHMDEFGLLHPLMPMSSSVRRQDMPKFFHVNGAIYVNDFSSLNTGTSLNDNPVAYLMSKDVSIDIDSLDDFLRAQEILEGLGEPQRID